MAIHPLGGPLYNFFRDAQKVPKQWQVFAGVSSIYSQQSKQCMQKDQILFSFMIYFTQINGILVDFLLVRAESGPLYINTQTRFCKS